MLNYKMKFRYIRNRIGEYDKLSLINNCVYFLKSSENGNKKRIPITDVLLLLKWTLIYGGKKYPSKKADIQKANWLVGLIGKLHNQHDFFLGKDKMEIEKLISLIAYQQSYFQLPIWKDSFARQIILFTKLKSQYSIEETFFKKTNISISDFILLSFILWVYADPDNKIKSNPFNGKIRDDFFGISSQIVNHECIRKFIGLLSIEYNNASQIIKGEEKIKSYNLQPYEISIFAKHPLFIIGKHIILLQKDLLKYTLNHFIYDFLKDGDNIGFTEEFGKRVEKYIELGLKEISLNYKTENQLKKELPAGSKIVDFIIDDEVLIECKAIELKPYPNVYPDDTVRYKWLKSSIVKAYSQQLMTVANAINPQKVKYGIIVTYKETYFGNGIDAWNSFLKNPTTSFSRENNLDVKLLPPEHLFFIDLSAWDKLLMVLKKGELTLIEILEQVIKNDKEDETKKFLFYMHLHDYDIGPVNLNYLNEAFKFFDCINGKNN